MQALIIDDEPQVRKFLSTILVTEGWKVSEAESAENALARLREEHWSLVFCDVNLGSSDGFTVLRKFTEEQPQAQVVLMTGQGTAVGALEATASGACDYLLKPFSVSTVKSLSQKAAQRVPGTEQSQNLEDHSDQRRGNVSSRREVRLIGQSASFIEVIKLIGRVAPTNLPVLINGESGTGKEVVARLLHERSRSEKEFVAVNCGALPAELIEAELFGHVRGAFTGADRDRVGLFEQADGGTIFLDEITETPLTFQVKLLRVLQEGEIRRVGSSRIQRVNVRIIAATNRDPDEEVRAGRFRQDLLYRLNAVCLNLPALRQRPEDILLLAKYFAERDRTLNTPLNFDPEVIRLLQSYPWPGNIRELENAMVRAAALCQHTIQPEDLPER
ncbi:MAG TPA: sigma-54 dependent transcriptional regulator, partial [Blastocatellia bacterium]|nr:sigma-54 dependent transcriptional regulator [Blastocatellia bacterium]